MDAEQLQHLQEDNAYLRQQVAQLQRELAELRAGDPPHREPQAGAPDTADAEMTRWRARWQVATLETLFAALPDYIFVVERGSMLMPFCNDVFARGIGFAGREEVEGRTIYDCFSPEDAARFAQQNERVFATGATLHELEQIELPGGAHHFDTFKIPIAGPGGEVIGLLGTSRDITELVETRRALAALNAELEQRIEQRTAELIALNHQLADEIAERTRAEEALRSSEWRYRLITEHSGDLILLIDLSKGGLILYASPSHLRVMGHHPEQLVGTRGIAGVHPDDMLEAQRIVQESIRLGFAEGPLRVKDRQGAYRWLEGRMTSFVQDDRIMAVLVAHDVTERRQLQAQLFQAQKLDGIGRLAGSVAHDFNNLLVVIGGSAELARECLPAEHPAQEDLREIQQATDRAAGLTRQLLTFARRQPSDPQTLDLNRLVGDLRRLLRRLLRENIQLVEALGPDLWPIRGDAGQLEQVIVNLAVNAQDAMPDGGTITVETANVMLHGIAAGMHPQLQAGAYVVLAVTDNGVGMTEEVVRQAFDPFFTTKPPGQGTGLGLSTCYGIVTQHAGGIYLYSEPGHGTVVKVYLPQAASGATEARSEDSAAPAGGFETVLLVEDELAVRSLAARVLRGQGYTVLEAGNGDEALEVATAHPGPIHLLLTDTVMPGMSGPALAVRLSKERPEVRVLIISGYTTGASIVSGLGTDAEQQLQKPFTPIALIRAVRTALDRPPETLDKSGMSRREH